MTRKYTAADFANARFAEHENGRTAMKSSGCTRWDVKFLEGHVSTRDDFHMASFGWVPVIPARTIHDRDVEALCADTASYERDDYLDGFIRGFQQAGGTILDDPEPTDEELLAGIIRNIDDWQSITSPELLAKYLNTAGVTPPNVKGN